MAKPKSSSLNTRNWRGAIFRDPVPDAMELARKVAGMELSAADRALLTEAQERARTRMSSRTIDETGRDISERRQPEPEPIRTGWYWTGTETVWVFGQNWGNTGVYYQATGGTAWAVTHWCTARKAKNWQRVHEQVQESGKCFAWRPPALND